MWTKTGSKNPVIQNEYLACTFLYKHSKAQQTFAKFVKGAPMWTTYLGSAMGVTQDIDGSYKMGCQNNLSLNYFKSIIIIIIVIYSRKYALFWMRMVQNEKKMEIEGMNYTLNFI